MFVKHYISILIVAISLFGIASHKQVDVPNQEIVVQFTDTNVSAKEVDGIINSIKLQLLELGVDEVSVSEDDHGELKIIYHSNSDVSNIKNKLAKEGVLKIDLNEKSHNRTDRTPLNNNVVSYNLDVYEIKDNTTNWNLNGINASIIDSKSENLFNPSTHLSTHVITINNDNSISKEAYKVLRNSVLSINQVHYKIPEVRAGPIN